MRARACSELAGRLNQAVRRIRQAATREELGETVADAAAAFATGAAWFRIEDGAARSEKLALTVPLAEAAALTGAVESREPVIALGSGARFRRNWWNASRIPPKAAPSSIQSSPEKNPPRCSTPGPILSTLRLAPIMPARPRRSNCSRRLPRLHGRRSNLHPRRLRRPLPSSPLRPWRSPPIHGKPSARRNSRPTCAPSASRACRLRRCGCAAPLPYNRGVCGATYTTPCAIHRCCARRIPQRVLREVSQHGRLPAPGADANAGQR